MTSLQSFDDLLSDIHKKDAPYKLSLIRAKASFSGLWVYKEDHTEVRILGAPGQDRAVLPDAGRGVPGHHRDRSGAPTSRSPRPARPTSAWRRAQVKLTEGNTEIPYSFEMPKWWEMREGVTIPAIPIGKPKEGGARATSPSATRTSRSSRPAPCARSIDFDTCVKCNLCWIACPDSCFDVMPDATFDANMEACCGCGVCEAVCPVENCITMVNESVFADNDSQWEMWRKDKADVQDAG